MAYIDGKEILFSSQVTLEDGELRKKVDELETQISNKQDKLTNNTDNEVVPIIIRNSSKVDYRTITPGAAGWSAAQRTEGGGLRVNVSEAELNSDYREELAVNLAYLNERLAGIGGGGGSLYIHNVAVACSNYMNSPYGSVYYTFLTNESTPITTLAEIHNLRNKQLSVDFNYYAEDNPDGARDATNAFVVAYNNNTYKMQITYVTAYTVPLTRESQVFNSDVCTISDTVMEV